VDVDAPMLGRIQDWPGQDQPVGRNDRKIGVECPELGLLFFIAERSRRPHLDPQLLGAFMHRGLALRLAAPRWPRRLAICSDDVMPRVDQRIEACHGELRRSHEDDAHGAALAGPLNRGQGVRIMASQEIEALSQALARLPGLGPRSARRAVLHLMKKRETALEPLLTALRQVADKLSTCSTCGNVDTSDPCTICRDPRRDEKMLCVVEEVADLWALDRSRLFPGRYHVLGGRLSALEGVRPEDLSIDQLVRRVSEGGIDEVVLAMNATLEGQTTAHYLAERLETFPIRLSQLAHGLPVGGELDYLDEGTLAQALRARRPIA